MQKHLLSLVIILTIALTSCSTMHNRIKFQRTGNSFSVNNNEENESADLVIDSDILYNNFVVDEDKTDNLINQNESSSNDFNQVDPDKKCTSSRILNNRMNSRTINRRTGSFKSLRIDEVKSIFNNYDVKMLDGEVTKSRRIKFLTILGIILLAASCLFVVGGFYGLYLLSALTIIIALGVFVIGLVLLIVYAKKWKKWVI